MIKLPTLLPVYAVLCSHRVPPNLAGAAGPGAMVWSGYQVVHAITHNKPGRQGGCASKTGVVVDFDFSIKVDNHTCSRGTPALGPGLVVGDSVHNLIP